MRWRRLLSIALVAIVSGCSGDNADETYCMDLAAATCEWARGCCELDELRVVLGLDAEDSYTVELLRKAQSDQDDCKDLVHASCVTQQRAVLESLRGKRVTLNGDRFDGCLKELRRAASSCDIGLSKGPSVAQACKLSEVFTGNEGNGDACFHELDCGEGTFCWRAGGGSGPGICRPLVAEDDPCRDTTKCQDNRACTPVETRASWCSPVDLQAEGDFCTNDALCAPGLFCDGSELACRAKGGGDAECNLAKHCLSGRCNKDARKCEAQRSKGDRCSSGQQCADDLWCNPVFAARSCSVPLETGKAGDPCDSQAPCSDELVCVLSRCRAPLAGGSPCSLSDQCNAEAYCSRETATCSSPRLEEAKTCTSSRDCRPEFYCGGTCRARVKAGEDCSNSAVCEMGTRCDETSRVCEPLRTEGQLCGTAQDCASGLICELFMGQCDDRLAGGTACDQSAACPASQYCGPAESERVCRALATATAGQSCASSWVRCGDGLFCDSRQACRPLGKEGEGCTATGQCGTGLYCGRLATCRAYAASGETCSTSPSSTDPLCGPGLVCDYDAVEGYTCEDLPGEGESCHGMLCAEGLYCSSTRECVKQVAEGEDCTSSTARMCADGLICDDATDKCVARKVEGEPCEVPDNCADGLRCHAYTGKCVDRTAEADACSREDECAAGLECEIESRCTPLAKQDEHCDAELACDDGLRCDPEWGVCVPLRGPFTAGDQCLVNEECFSGTCINYVCTGGCQGVGR